MKTLSKVPAKLWVEFLLYSLGTIAIQIFAHLIR